MKTVDQWMMDDLREELCIEKSLIQRQIGEESDEAGRAGGLRMDEDRLPKKAYVHIRLIHESTLSRGCLVVVPILGSGM